MPIYHAPFPSPPLLLTPFSQLIVSHSTGATLSREKDEFREKYSLFFLFLFSGKPRDKSRSSERTEMDIDPLSIPGTESGRGKDSKMEGRFFFPGKKVGDDDEVYTFLP